MKLEIPDDAKFGFQMINEDGSVRTQGRNCTFLDMLSFANSLIDTMSNTADPSVVELYGSTPAEIKSAICAELSRAPSSINHCAFERADDGWA